MQFVPLVRHLTHAVLLAAPLTAQALVLEMRPFPGSSGDVNIAAIAESADGNLWLAHRDGLRRHDGAGTVALRPASNDPRRSWSVVSLTTADDTAYVATSQGVWHANGASATLERLAGTADLLSAAAVAGTHGTLWLLRTDGTLSWWHDGSTTAVVRDGGDRVRGLAGSGDDVWAWTEGAVLRLSRQPTPSADVVVPLRDVRAATTRGGELVVATGHGVYSVAADGTVTQRCHDDRCSEARQVVAGRDAIWVLTKNDLWHIDGDDGRIAAVQLNTVSGTLPTAAVGPIAADRQGLLWIACYNTIYRSVMQPAIRNCRLSELDNEEAVTAVVEHEGTMWLGTGRGRLLQQTLRGWATVATPWSDEHAQRPGHRTVEAMYSAPTGQLIVGTRRCGTWIWRDRWQRVATGVEDVRSLVVSERSHLWIAAGRALYAADLDAPEPMARLLQELPDPGRAGSLVVDAEGTVWLAAYRGGLWRRRAGEATFREQAPEWRDQVVLHLAVAGNGRRLWIATGMGLWSLDVSSGQSTSIHDTSRRGVIRFVAGLPDGSVWLTQGPQLAHFAPDTHTLRVLPTACGSHPGSYSHRATATGTDGRLWFGAEGGYTRLSPDAHLRLDWPVRLGRTTVSADGRDVGVITAPGNSLRLPAQPEILAIDPILIDRSSDDDVPHEVLLRSADATLHSANGRFPDVLPGRYTIHVVATRASGSRTVLDLGHLEVPAPPLRWPWWLGAAVATTGLGVWSWRRSRPHPEVWRKIDLGGVNTIVDASEGGKLELAWLAVVTAESTALRIAPRHTSVWLHRRSTGERVRLARFGNRCPDAAERLVACCSKGVAVGDRVYFADHGEHKDLVVCAANDGDCEFEILMHRVPRIDEQTLADVATSAGPLIAGMQKDRWIDRLEHDMVRKTATLEAEAHDLRSPLTVLRMAVFELGELAAASSDDRVRTAADTASGALDNVVRAFDHLVAQFRSTADMHPVLVDPAAIALQIARRLQPVATRKGIKIATFSTMEVMRVRLDEAWFTRVVENVIGNAVKYSPRGSTVRLHAAIVGEEFVMRCEDEGPGFTAMEREAVFLPGIVGRAEPTGGESKTGMGLWIARQALRAMGGRIWIDDRDGGGAAVMIALPRPASA